MSAEVSRASQPQQEENRRQSWSEYGKEWAVYGKEKYNEKYENWMPWIEDMYLRWFTKDNKASYTVKGMFRNIRVVDPSCSFPSPLHFVINIVTVICSVFFYLSCQNLELQLAHSFQ